MACLVGLWGSRDKIVRKKICRRFTKEANCAEEENWGGFLDVLLGREWVCEAARPAFVNLPDNVAVTIGSWKDEGRLPLTEWGRVEW